MTGASEAAATKMVIASDGDVGIGTTAPAGVLHLKDGSIIVGKGDASNNAQIGRIGFSTDSGNSRFIGMESHRGSDAANADLRFHTYGGDSDNGERVRIHTNGVLSASDGIALGVGTNNTTSNVLDDYEEGSFTPQYRGSAGSAGSLAYTDQTARYTKIGRVVNVQIRLVLSNKGSFSSGGNIEIYGLPFTVTNVGAPPPASLEIRQTDLSNHTVIASFSDGNTYCLIKELQSGDNPASVTHNAARNNSVFIINGSYISE